MTCFRLRLLALAALTFLPGVTLHAQALASPFSTISQKVDSTTITVEYYRPSVRGRSIFGALVRWRQVWTPGANWATTLDVNRDVLIEGQALPRGKYSMWMIPAARPNSWTVVLNRAARRFHVVRPDPADDQLRFQVSADSGPHVELLTFSFPVVTRTSAMLLVQWATTVVPVRFEIESSRPVIVAAHPWSTYAGVYELRGASDGTSAPIRYEIIARETGLWVRTTHDAVESGLDVEFDLMPGGGDDFHPRQYKGGRLIGTELDEVIRFQLNGTRVTGFEVHGVAEDKVLARATRVAP